MARRFTVNSTEWYVWTGSSNFAPREAASARTGVLLCWHHHTHVHNNDIEVTWQPGIGWVFTDRNGKIILRN